MAGALGLDRKELNDDGSEFHYGRKHKLFQPGGTGVVVKMFLLAQNFFEDLQIFLANVYSLIGFNSWPNLIPLVRGHEKPFEKVTFSTSQKAYKELPGNVSLGRISSRAVFSPVGKTRHQNGGDGIREYSQHAPKLFNFRNYLPRIFFKIFKHQNCGLEHGSVEGVFFVGNIMIAQWRPDCNKVKLLKSLGPQFRLVYMCLGSKLLILGMTMTPPLMTGILIKWVSIKSLRNKVDDQTFPLENMGLFGPLHIYRYLTRAIIRVDKWAMKTKP